MQMYFIHHLSFNNFHVPCILTQYVQLGNVGVFRMAAIEIKTITPPFLEREENTRLLNEIKAIRNTVFVEGQGVDPSIEQDGLDETLDHILLFSNGSAAGVLRFHRQDEETVKFERIAVLPEYRGLGYGKRLVKEALSVAEHKGFEQAVMHAQYYLLDYYRSLGFNEEGEPFLEADIKHITMSCRLKKR